MSASNTQEKLQELLRNRAKKIATKVDEVVPGQNTQASYAFVRVGNQRFAFEMTQLLEIRRTPQIAHLPGMPGFIMGVIQIRGELVSVISLADWCSVREAVTSDYLVVLDNPKGYLGIVVDAVTGFGEISDQDINKTFVDSSQGNRPVRAVTHDMVAVIDIDKAIKMADVNASKGTEQ